MKREGKNLFVNKKGALGENTIMIARLILLAFVTFILLGVSSLVYSYDINVRDVEARVMARSVVNCFVENDVLRKVNGNSLKDEKMLYNILDYCGITGDLEKYYVKLTIIDFEGNEKILQQGDSGAKWVRDIKGKYENAEQYLPGYFEKLYFVKNEVDGQDKSVINIKVEVLVNADV